MLIQPLRYDPLLPPVHNSYERTFTMNNIRIILLALCTITVSLLGQTGADYYLPLKKGNFLLYDTPSNNMGWGARTTRVFIDGTDTIGGQIYYRQIGTETGTSGTDTFHVIWLRKDQTGSILVGAFAETDINPGLAMVFNPPLPYFPNQFLVPGYVLNYEGDKDSIISTTETVQVTGGVFQNCILIQRSSYDDSGRVRRNDYAYYAKNIGEVKNVRNIPASQAHVRSLISYQALLAAEHIETSMPRSIELSQNYPNPFNPSTTIRYALPASAHVTLSVHDILGRVVATLVNEIQTAGWKEIQWKADASANGVYFYRLTAGRFFETRKMTLVK
jgi:hypothetical protein